MSHNDEKYFDEIECPVLPLYEELESAGPITFSSKDKRKHGTSGKPVEGTTVEIEGEKDKDGNGEIVALKPNLFSGYFEEPKSFDEKSERRKNWKQVKSESWMKKDFCCSRFKLWPIQPNDGNIDQSKRYRKMLMQHPLVDDAVVFGNGRKYLIALLTIDEKEAQDLANANNSNLNISFTSLFNETIQNHVDSVNENFRRKRKS